MVLLGLQRSVITVHTLSSIQVILQQLWSPKFLTLPLRNNSDDFCLNVKKILTNKLYSIILFSLSSTQLLTNFWYSTRNWNNTFKWLGTLWAILGGWHNTLKEKHLKALRLKQYVHKCILTFNSQKWFVN